jgi:hypothetical protein
VGEDERAVGEDAYGVHFGGSRREELEEGAEASEAVGYAEVVLDVLGWVEEGDRGGVAGFDALEEVNYDSFLHGVLVCIFNGYELG